MKPFCWGALAMAGAVAAIFFTRYWRISGERLFLYFALSFGALAAQWTASAVLDPAGEGHPRIYVVRLVAFILLAIGILDKNRRSRLP